MLGVHYATTSAALKLLRRRRTLLSPGLSDLDPGTTTALALFVIHASEAAPAILSVTAEATSLSEFVALCVRLAGMRVGNRDGVGEGGARGRRAAGVGARAVAAVFRAVVPAASLGILLGPCPLVTGFRVTPAVDLNTRVGRCSEAVAREPVPRMEVFLTGGTTPRAGNTSALSSSSSSSSESTATLFATGVFLGCSGGAIAFAFAWAAAMCLLGVTGGTGTLTAMAFGGVICMASISSSASAGGVAGVTRVADASAAAACVFRNSSTAAHLHHSSCLRYMYCC